MRLPDATCEIKGTPGARMNRHRVARDPIAARRAKLRRRSAAGSLAR